jgi:hypothetical protein
VVALDLAIPKEGKCEAADVTEKECLESKPRGEKTPKPKSREHVALLSLAVASTPLEVVAAPPSYLVVGARAIRTPSPSP